jgi:DNA-directed RNA polymerase
MEDIRQYLLEKIRKEDLGVKPRRNIQLMRMIDTDGVDMLDFLIEDMIIYARKFIQRCFKRSKVEGETPITQASMAIGKYIVEGWDSTNVNFRDHVRVGDLVIEGFVMCGYLTISVGHLKSRKPVTIHATQKWGDMEIIAGKTNCISENAIPPITSLIQNNGRSVIKTWDRSKEYLFLKHKDAPFVKAIDKLQSTRFKVNTAVHQAILEHKDMFIKNEVFAGKDKNENDKLYQRQASKNREVKEIMAVAAKWLHKEFYFYIDADYRGRLYYSEPFFNFQGSDIARGQLLFAEGKRFDESANFWLAVHTACCYNASYSVDEIPKWTTTDYKVILEDEGLDTISVDKMTLEDRAMWTQQHLEDILELGEMAIISTEAEKEISFLACCIEWYNYSKAQEDGVDFYTHLPLPIDGANNGWQHLGAMSKDSKTGNLVGLIPTEVQNDFYVQIAKRLTERMPEWFEERQMPMKHIRKGIAKRAAMTRAYSCGQKKMSESMYSDCYQYGYTDDYNISEYDCIDLSGQIIKAIEEVCPGPLETMKYLQRLADQEITNWMTLYGTDRGHAIEWTTPSGFPVIYECYRTRPAKVDCYGFNTPDGEIRFKHVIREKTDIPDRRGFMCGISPNFVHSMDASHMALVVANWDSDFGAVHDSFSTYATDVEPLMEETRNQFVKIYDKENFYESIEFGKGFNGTQPSIGNLDIKQVVNSNYFFC